jgi:hypothetical protein
LQNTQTSGRFSFFAYDLEKEKRSRRVGKDAAIFPKQDSTCNHNVSGLHYGGDIWHCPFFPDKKNGTNFNNVCIGARLCSRNPGQP